MPQFSAADPIVILSYARTPMGGMQGALADVSATDREHMIEQGYTGQVVPLGGADALKIPPKQTPFKVVVLWVVLVVGVALLVGMALSLLKRVRQPLN